MLPINKKWSIVLLMLSQLAVLCSCKKYLDAKSDQSLTIPNSLTDLQSLMDNYSYLNSLDPGDDEISADNYYLTNADWSTMTEPVRRMYIWEKDHLFMTPASEWNVIYRKVYYANTVLESIQKIDRNVSNQVDWDYIKGQALFFRAKSFLHIAFTWSLAYDKVTAASDLGIPLRLNSDFNIPSARSTVEQTYDQIIRDLKESMQLLVITPKHVMRPSRPAAYALLARAYLSMRKYDSAFRYSDLCLQLKNELMDYNVRGNGINSSGSYTFQEFNPEVIFYSTVSTPAPLKNSIAKIDSNLYKSYASDDLRKTLFFKNNNNGTFGFKGGYSGNGGLFTGMAIDEVYLMRAECFARAGNVTSAMEDLNFLLEKRWKTGSFSPVGAINAADALEKILMERRKELLMRGLRWMDIKRLNKEGAQITLKRVINGQNYLLFPNDLRYALPIPEDVITLSGMQQNYR